MSDFCLITGNICPKLGFVEGAEFIRKVRKLGMKRGVTVAVDTSHGKGSHAMLRFGNRLTTVRKAELSGGTLHAILKQLGLRLDDLN